MSTSLKVLVTSVSVPTSSAVTFTWNNFLHFLHLINIYSFSKALFNVTFSLSFSMTCLFQAESIIHWNLGSDSILSLQQLYSIKCLLNSGDTDDITLLALYIGEILDIMCIFLYVFSYVSKFYGHSVFVHTVFLVDCYLS